MDRDGGTARSVAVAGTDGVRLSATRVAAQHQVPEAARVFADRALAEPAAEPATVLGAHALHARAAVDQGQLDDAARHIRALTVISRRMGLLMAQFEALVRHARLLAAQGARARAAAQLQFVRHHPGAPVPARQGAATVADSMVWSHDDSAAAQQAAKGLDFDVLLDAAANCEAGI
jgi:ATP/maltotriose-dependent transcriptional regulator MalT